jgi:valyl-tRNA synthetase
VCDFLVSKFRFLKWVELVAATSRWALSRLNHAVKMTVDAMETYDFNNATQGVYAFWQYDLCDVFIELMKPVMFGTDEAAKKATRDTLWACLDAGLRLLHPFMPFVTEELWQRLPRRKCEAAPSIMVADYPAHIPSRTDDGVEADMAVAQDIIKSTRSLRAAYNLSPKAKPELFVVARTAAATAAATSFAGGVATLAGCASVTVLSVSDAAPTGCGVTVINEAVTIYLLLRGVVDPAAEIQKLTKKIALVEKQIADLEKKMNMAGYETKVPESVQKDHVEKMDKLKSEIGSTTDAITDVQNLMNEK